MQLFAHIVYNEQAIVRSSLWGPPTRVGLRAARDLLGQVGPTRFLSQLSAHRCGQVAENCLCKMRIINHVTSHEGYFPWSTKNIFKLTNILRCVKH